jgi:hypothetical protein
VQGGSCGDRQAHHLRFTHSPIWLVVPPGADALPSPVALCHKAGSTYLLRLAPDSVSTLWPYHRSENAQSPVSPTLPVTGSSADRKSPELR